MGSMIGMKMLTLMYSLETAVCLHLPHINQECSFRFEDFPKIAIFLLFKWKFDDVIHYDDDVA